MSEPESIIIVISGALLLLITASKFLMQELISLVLLYKKLCAAIKSKYPSEPEWKDVPDTRQKTLPPKRDQLRFFD